MEVSQLLAKIAQSGQEYLQNADNGDDKPRKELIEAASSIIEHLWTPKEFYIKTMIYDITRLSAIRVAIESGVLAKLDPNKPLTSSELAAGTAADAALIARTMKHLAANNIVKEVNEDQYLGTSITTAMNGQVFAGTLKNYFELLQPIQQETPKFLARTNYQMPTSGSNCPMQSAMGTDKPFFAFLHESERLSTNFNYAMRFVAEVQAHWSEYYPCQERLLKGVLGEAPLLVDVGGGTGIQLKLFDSRFPTEPGKLILEDTLTTISQVEKATPRLPASIEAIAHDFFTPQPAKCCGARAYILRLVLHDWPDDKCHIILNHVRNAMKPGYSKLLIQNTVIPNIGAPKSATAYDWSMMGFFAARERTEAQWRSLLAVSGFKVVGIWSKDSASASVIEAVLADE